MYRSINQEDNELKSGDLLTADPKSSPSTFAPSNSYLLINIKPDEKWVFVAWLSFIFSFDTNLKWVKRTNFYPNPLKYECKYSIFP